MDAVRKGDKLYGRGGADDGYAMFGSLAALLALKEQNVAPCALRGPDRGVRGIRQLRPALLCRSSGGRIGIPSLVVCLDSGCGNYDQLWLTTSLRGMAMGKLTVRVLEEGVHSGDASGIVPSSFRILRQLLARIEDPATGSILLDDFLRPDSARTHRSRRASRRRSGQGRLCEVSLGGRRKPVTDDLKELILNRTWRPQLAVTGMDGCPAPNSAGNVLLPFTTRNCPCACRRRSMAARRPRR